MLPFKGTFPIGNLIPEPRLGFLKDLHFHNYGVNSLGFSFLFNFPFQNKNKISGDSNFLKINFSPNKSEFFRSSRDTREKCGSTKLATPLGILRIKLEHLLGKMWRLIGRLEGTSFFRRGDLVCLLDWFAILTCVYTCLL